MKYRFTLALAVVAWACSVAAGADSRAAPPSDAALNDAVKMVDETFRDHITNSRTLEQRVAVAGKLLDFSRKEKDAAGRFALLLRARDVALDCGDLAVALTAINDVGKTFAVDAAGMRIDAITVAGKTAQTPLQRKRLSVEARDEARRALVADRYDLARAMVKIAGDAARLAGDPELMAVAAAEAGQVTEAEAAYPGATRALAVLVQNPRDADANLAVGKFRCLIKEDWERGLPMLALGSDPGLKALASKEMAGAAGEPLALMADAWWKMADKIGGATAGRIRLHAANDYARALPQLAGLHRALADKRMQEMAAATAAAAAATAEARRNIVDLLPLLDTARGAVAGNWAMRDDGLNVFSDFAAHLQFPYHPPAEYDMHVRFVRVQGNGPIALILASHGQQFSWMIGDRRNTVLQFEIIEERNPNPTALRLKPAIVNGRVYETTVKVRGDGVEAYLNDRRVAAWKTDYKDMSISSAWTLKDRASLGIGARDSDAKFLAVTVTEISGKGEITGDRKSDR